jgi:hypothetical protein
MRNSKTQARELTESITTIDLATQDERTPHQINRNNYKFDVLLDWKAEFTERIRIACKSRKQEFNYFDSLIEKSYHTARDKCFIEASNFLGSNPLKNNDYAKYINCYVSVGRKLNLKFFRHDVAKLDKYYAKVDEAIANGINYNPFRTLAYSNYVVFIFLKLRGHYSAADDELFNVRAIDSRDYNPLTNIPSVLKGELPFKVKEYDMYRGLATMIDSELGKDYRHTVYEIFDKKTYASLLNANSENPKNDITSLRKSLSIVYGADASKVLTDERFNSKGKLFLDYAKYEKESIEKFVDVHQLNDYVRLHDSVVVPADVECNFLDFDLVKFSIKECIKPPIENECLNFYSIDDNGKVTTSRTMYADFFIQEKFKRISTPDDKIQLLVDTNNIVDFFNHRTNIVSFLESNINEFGADFDKVRETIAKECNTVIYQSFTLIPPAELLYYSDTRTSFGLPFKNGFFYFDMDKGEIKSKEYIEVKGFFSPHKIQSREFEYTDEVGMFEQFLTRVAIGRKVANSTDTKNINSEFQKMFGYLCHTYKSQTTSPCIIFTDLDANDENRNGGRGKTIVTKAVSEILTTMFKGGKEFDASYTHVFADLEKKHRVYIIDDVPAGFKYDDLYTNVSGGISCQKKGLKAEFIEFEHSPKFLITTNWVVRYDEKNASTNRRFLEYKFLDYYNQAHTPKDDFGCTFFEDWDAEEYNKFYSFVFRCVKQFLTEGLKQIPYNKTNDNYLASFRDLAMAEEFERIISILFETEIIFGVSQFLNIYNASDNPLRCERLFHTKNVRKLIDIWLSKNSNEEIARGWKFSTDKKKWIKHSV